jgi:plastocyanin
MMHRNLLVLLLGLGTAAVSVSGALLLWSSIGSAPTWSPALGTSSVAVAPVGHSLSISLSMSINNFEPRAGVIVSGGTATFSNNSDTPLVIRTAARAPQSFALRVGPDGRATIRLVRPGLYHYYDALTSHLGPVVANNQVVTSAAGSSSPREGWLAVITRAPAAASTLTVPRGQDLFSPKLIVAVVGDTIVVANHDEDAHNFVVDPASPTGAAFVLDGTQNEPPSGWKRVLVLRTAGLYHIYCTFHTRVVGTQDGWHVVVPRPKASGYHSHNPMEAWIVVLPVAAAG